MSLNQLFSEHIKTRQSQIEALFTTLNLQSLVLDAGQLRYFHDDDQMLPFRSNHHFAYWCPLRGPGHLLVLKKGERPLLLRLEEDDFWHQPSPDLESWWADHFEIKTFKTAYKIWQQVDGLKGAAFVGSEVRRAKAAGLQVEVSTLKERLNWERSFKSPFEIYCLEKASELGAKAHGAAKSTFENGGTELDIYYAFLQALRATDEDLPYKSIVCLDRHSAILHYHGRNDQHRQGKVLLIDAGAKYLSFGSDITRTYLTSEAPKAFKDLLISMEKNQLKLCDGVRVGAGMGELHMQSHHMLAELLIDSGLLKGVSAAEAVEQRLTNVFYPHGLGHMLGIFIHDVGGRQRDAVGNPTSPVSSATLRSNRLLEASNVVTIEPGLYFIDLLLKKAAADQYAGKFNWSLIEQLKPCGGIRIEDNVVVTDGKPVNLTRTFLKDSLLAD